MAFRNVTEHKLDPLRGFDRTGYMSLVVNGKVNAVEAALMTGGYVPAGRCMHIVPAGSGPDIVPEFKLGCVGDEKIPVFLFRDSDSYSAGFPGPDASTHTGPTWATGGNDKLLALVGFGAYELRTTEFDTAQTYLVGQNLKSIEYDGSGATQANNVAGKLTNAANRRIGIETIVGVVSPGGPEAGGPINPSRTGSPMQAVDPHGNKVLTFYTRHYPPTYVLSARSVAS